MTRGLRPIGEPSRVPPRPLNTTATATATEASSGHGPQTAPAAPPPNPRTAARKAKHAASDAQRRANPVPIGGPDSPRHKFRALRQNPENMLLHDSQFEEKYGLKSQTTVQILGPQSGERNGGFRGLSEATRNSILAKGGPDIGFNPKGDLEFRRGLLMLIPDPEAPAAPPDPRPAAGKSIQAEKEAQRRANPVPIGGPGSPRHEYRALRQNPENALLPDTQFDKKYGLVKGTTVNILGPKSGERNAGMQGVTEKNRNSILANGGPDVGFNPKGDLDFRRKLLMLIPDQSTAAEAADKAPGINPRPTYPIGGPGSPRHEFRALRQNPENARLKDADFERKYGLMKGTTVNILGPQSGERNAGKQGVTEATQNSILANGGPDIGFNPRGSLDLRRKALGAAAGEGPAKRPRLDTGLQNEPSMSDPFMAHQSPFAGQYRQDEAGPSSRPLPPSPLGGGHRSPSPDPQQDYIDAILQSFKEY